jgi:hypothetical protein
MTFLRFEALAVHYCGRCVHFESADSAPQPLHWPTTHYQACITVFTSAFNPLCSIAVPAVLAAQPLTQQQLPGSVYSGPIPVKAQWQLDQEEGEPPAAAAAAAAAARVADS